VRPLRDALAQLQMAYANEVGAGTASEPEPGAGGGEPSREGGQSGARRGSRGGLWVPPGSE
jgi:hypothetical protein